MSTSSSSRSSRRNRKIAAVAAGLLVVGVGATYTLASWNDSEWVWGGADGDPGIGTSEFNVQQDATSPYAAPGAFGDFESNPGDELTFSAGAVALTPGDSTYAPVALRTATDSISGDVVLQGAVPAAGVTVADTGNLLWDAIRVDVYTSTGASPAGACDATGIAATGWLQIVADATLGTVANDTQSLDANAGSTQHYCFVLNLPDTPANQALQGKSIAPAWEFAATSN